MKTKVFSPSEKKILRKIKLWINDFLTHDLNRLNIGEKEKRYDFWLVYDENNDAVTWEGGFNISPNVKFRNKYSIEDGKITQNW